MDERTLVARAQPLENKTVLVRGHWPLGEPHRLSHSRDVCHRAYHRSS